MWSEYFYDLSGVRVICSHFYFFDYTRSLKRPAMEANWSSSSPNSELPTTAIRGGQLYIPTYVGRAEHNGLQLAATVTSNRHAYVAWEGKVHMKPHFDILTGDGYKWRKVEDHQIPDNAVICFKTSSGGALYVGRGLHKENLIVGTIRPARGVLISSHDGKEVQLKTYEILVYDKNPIWRKATNQTIPAEAVVAGHDTDGAVIYVGRALHLGAMLPAKVIPSKTCCYVAHEGAEVYKPEFEVLCGVDYTWRQPMIMGMSPDAVYTDVSKDGEVLFIGRGHYNGSLTPGVVDAVKRCLTLSYGGRTVKLDDYEVLIKQ